MCVHKMHTHAIVVFVLQVEVLWVINQQQTAWEAALPQDVAAALANTRASRAQQRQAGAAASQPGDSAGGQESNGGVLGSLTQNLQQGLQAAQQGVQEVLGAVGKLL